MSWENCYSDRTTTQRKVRSEKRKRASVIPPDSSSSESDDFDADATDRQSSTGNDNPLRSSTLNDINLLDYVADEHDNINEGTSVLDDSPLLFPKSSYTVGAATTSLMQFAVDAKLDKLHTIRLLKLVKSLLPQPNCLPVSHKSILKTFGHKSSFSTKFYCYLYSLSFFAYLSTHEGTCLDN